MATFTVTGFEIASGPDNQVSGTKAAQLQIVAPLGHATLDFRYVADGTSSAEVSLSDYNILLNGQHLNDGVLPDRIELFDLSWSTEQGDLATSQVVNLAFSEGENWRDCIFSVANSPLPNLTDPDTASSVLTNAAFSVLDGAHLDKTYTIQLNDMPDVSVAGVIQQMFEAEQSAQDDFDQFEFSYNPDSEAPDLTEFDISARAQTTNDLSPRPADEQSDDFAAELFDPEINIPSYDDMTG